MEAEGEGHDNDREESEKGGEDDGDSLEHEEVDTEKWEVGQHHEDIDPDQGDHHASHLLTGLRADAVRFTDLENENFTKKILVLKFQTYHGSVHGGDSQYDQPREISEGIVEVDIKDDKKFEYFDENIDHQAYEGEGEEGSVSRILSLVQDCSEPVAVVGEDQPRHVDEEGEVEAKVVGEIDPADLSILQVEERLGHWVLQ